MARINIKAEFGYFIATSDDYPTLYVTGESRELLSERLALILVALEPAIAHEREACAKIADSFNGGTDDLGDIIAKGIADGIRSRTPTIAAATRET